MANQKKWMADLKAFLDKYPKADEAPDALLQLASANEFNAEEDEARKYYDQLVAATSPTTDPGKKAAGALRRLDLVGKSLVLKGTGPARTRTIDTDAVLAARPCSSPSGPPGPTRSSATCPS